MLGNDIGCSFGSRKHCCDRAGSPPSGGSLSLSARQILMLPRSIAATGSASLLRGRSDNWKVETMSSDLTSEGLRQCR
jgi:hypothetical protein